MVVILLPEFVIVSSRVADAFRLEVRFQDWSVLHHIDVGVGPPREGVLNLWASASSKDRLASPQ